jgi:hypothetical protein
MHRWLEFHDSELLSVEQTSDAVTFLLNAYVHQWERDPTGWRGTGWAQPVHVRIANPSPIKAPATPVDVWRGTLHCGTVEHSGGVPLPYSTEESVRLELDLNDGTALRVVGSSVAFRSNGDPTYIEDLPEDFRPTDAA